MASFVVMQSPGSEGEERTQFIRDGFSIVAFVLPFVWLAWHRLWIEALLVFAVAVLLGVLGEMTALGGALSPLMTFLGLYIAVDGAALRVAALNRREWREKGVVEADNLDDAETRWFADGGLHEPPAPEQTPLPPALPRPSTKTAGPALGLLAYPGKS
jgi:Protein of unknown function (DUF2628)